jgi:nucleoside-diphosphate-sugar epimerase
MSELVFVTGGSGHIGSRVIIDALEAGYSIRAAVRSRAKADRILSIPAIKKLNPGKKLEFAIVPDLLVEGAYDEAIKGATLVIHVASPIPDAHKEGESYQTTLIDPAVKGTLNILEAAKNAGTIKRVIITSSVVATISWKGITSGDTEGIPYDEKSRTPFQPEPYGDTFDAYCASKVAALNESEKWLEQEKASISFDIVNIFPSFVIGRDELVTDAQDALRGTNMVVLGPVTGAELSYTPGASVHIRDVSLAHVKSLDLKVPGNQGYLISAGGLKGTRWEESLDLVARHFPEAVKAGTLKNNGTILSVPQKINASASEKALGLKYLNYEEQVTDVVGYYLELLTASG